LPHGEHGVFDVHFARTRVLVAKFRRSVSGDLLICNFCSRPFLLKTVRPVAFSVCLCFGNCQNAVIGTNRMGIVMRKVFFLFGLTAFLIQPTFGTTTISLMNMGKLAEKCTSGDANDNVVCDAYIAGAVDALGNVWGQGIGSKAVNENARCLSEKRFELSQARAAVMKALDSAKNNPVRDVPAVHSVIAAVTVYLCSPENDPKNRHRQPF